MIEISIFRNTPGRGHAEAGRPSFLCGLSGSGHLSSIHQTGGLHPGVIMGALRAIAAIFRTASGLDTEQGRGFDVVCIEILAVNAQCSKYQISERQAVQALGLCARPIIANGLPGAPRFRSH